MAYNRYFSNKRKNPKDSQTNSSASTLPLVEERDLQSVVSPGKIEISEARKTGILTLSGLSLNEVPSEVYLINLPDNRRIEYNGFADKDSKAWWEDMLLNKLDLSSNKISTLDSNIKFLRNLTHLDLRENNIESLPEEFADMCELTYLDFSKNRFSELPSHIGALTQLSHLILSNNNLRALPREVCRLTNLEVLNLSNNQFSFIPETIGYFIKLRSLSLAGNNLKRLPEVTTKLKALTFIDASRNKLIDFPQSFEANLQVIRLNINALTWFPIFKYNPALKELYISNNKITTFSACHISFIPNVIILLMSKNVLIDLPPEITQLRNLTNLDVSYNSLNAIPYELGNMDSIKELKMEGNPFRGINRKALISGTDALKRYLRTRNEKEQGLLDMQVVESSGTSGVLEDSKHYNSLELDIHSLNSTGTINLSNRRLKSIPEQWFLSFKLRRVKSLLLSYNQLSEFPAGISPLATNITLLDISYNDLHDLPDTFNHFVCLEHLNLSGNYLTGLPRTLDSLKGVLTTLNLAHNPLGPEIPKLVFKLKSLQTLNVSNCSIAKLDPSELMKLKGLLHLDLSNNQIEIIPPRLGLCEQIRTLNLYGNQIRDPPLSLLDHGTELMFQFLRSQIIDQA